MRLEYLSRDKGARVSYAARFASALTDPNQPTPSGIAGPNGKKALTRYNVYRNNVTVSLINALAAIYPAVRRITGPDFFRAMARSHIRETPPKSPLLFEYGRDFPDFIQRYEYASGMPWLADTAHIERAWLDAYHAADAPVLCPSTLAEVSADRLVDVRFAPHPATRIVRSGYPAVAIFSMNRVEGPVTPLQSSDAEDALVTRLELDVAVRLLPPGGAAFLTALIAGETLAAAANAAITESPYFDLQANIAGMLEAGVFTALQLGD